MACWLAGAVSASANWMLSLSIPFLVFEMTSSTSWLGLSAMAANLPSLIASPLGGYWADRFPKRVVLVLTLAVQVSIALALYAIGRAEALTVSNLIGLAAAMGFASSTHLSAYQAFVAEIVPARQIGPAYRLNAIQFNTSRAIGPALAGFVLAGWGPTTAFLVNALAYLPLATVLLFVTPRQLDRAPSEGILRSLRAGARISWQDRRLRLALLTVSTSALFGMSVQQLAAGLAKDVFRVGEAGLGILVSSIGIAAVATAITTVLIGERMRRSTMVRVGLVVYGLGLFIVAATDVFVFGVIGFAITGFAHVLVNVSVTTAIQMVVPEAFRGRVTSLQLMGIIVSMPIGAQLGGLLAERSGLPLVVALYGGALIGYAGWAHWRMDGLRDMD